MFEEKFECMECGRKFIPVKEGSGTICHKCWRYREHEGISELIRNIDDMWDAFRQLSDKIELLDGALNGHLVRDRANKCRGELNCRCNHCNDCIPPVVNGAPKAGWESDPRYCNDCKIHLIKEFSQEVL